MHEHEISFFEFRNFSQAVTDKVSTIAKEGFNGSFEEWKKVDGTLVTNIDLEIEKTIRNEITKEYPQHSIRGEEEKDKICNSDYSWILDPLDGTLNYSSGIPFYGILLGLCFKDKPIYGSYRLPSYGNIFCAGNDVELFSTGFKIKNRKVLEWENRLLLTTDESRLESSRFSKNWKELKKLLPTVRTWGDCFGYHMLCSGKADAMIDLDLKECDILPLLPVVKAAGLSVIKLDKNSHSDIIVSDPIIETELKTLFGI